MKKQITIGQVKQIALEISENFELVNRGNYYIVIDKKTRQSSLQGGRNNLVSYSMNSVIEFTYLNLINENGNYFDWSINGVDVTKERHAYVFKIKQKIVELLCGYKY